MLTDTEIKILEERLDFAPTQLQINEAELKQDFKDFCRSLHLSWYFWDERQEFSETPAFSTKSSQNPPSGHPSLELLLVRLNTNSKADKGWCVMVWDRNDYDNILHTTKRGQQVLVNFTSQNP